MISIISTIIELQNIWCSRNGFVFRNALDYRRADIDSRCARYVFNTQTAVQQRYNNWFTRIMILNSLKALVKRRHCDGLQYHCRALMIATVIKICTTLLLWLRFGRRQKQRKIRSYNTHVFPSDRQLYNIMCGKPSAGPLFDRPVIVIVTVIIIVRLALCLPADTTRNRTNITNIINTW
jgi:hypothetical protein